MRLEMLFSRDEFEDRVAVLENGVVKEVYISSREKPDILGNIYLGKVKDLLSGMQSSFVDIGLDEKAFLPFSETLRNRLEPLEPGRKVVVQISRYARGIKGPRLTEKISLPGRYVVYFPFSLKKGVSKKMPASHRERLKKWLEELSFSQGGVVLRTAAAEASYEQIWEEFQELKSVWERMKRRSQSPPPKLLYSEPPFFQRILRDFFNSSFDVLVVDSEEVKRDVGNYLEKKAPWLLEKVKIYKSTIPLFEKFGVEREIWQALERDVPLPSGGFLVIEETEALTVVDVNTGGFIKGEFEEIIFQTNVEAAKEIARQIRLRDIGGLIVIDFIDMKEEKHRSELNEILSREFSKDRSRWRKVGLSHFGLVEMTRKKVGHGLSEFYTVLCSRCRGNRKELSRRAIEVKTLREIKKFLRVRAEAYLFKIHPEVLSCLLKRKDILSSWERRYGVKIFFLTDASLSFGEVQLLKSGLMSEIKPLAKGSFI